MRKGPAVILLLTFLIAAAYGAQRALSEGMMRVARFSPAIFQAPRPAAGPPPLAGRVVLVALDGLRAEDVVLLPSLDWLERRGASFRLTVPAPGSGAPVLTTFLTGALPTTHGVLSPAASPKTGADALTAAAQRARLTVGGVGSEHLGSLAGLPAGSWQTPAAPDKLLDAVRPLLGSGGPGLTVIQLTRLGTARQPDLADPTYKDLLATTDADLVRMLELLDLKTTAVVVAGLPGGAGPVTEVPLIMAGAGVREGARGTGALTDVAPTVAALLGSPVPAQTQGSPLLDGLAAEGRPADLILSHTLQVKRGVAEAGLAALGDTQPLPEAPASAAEADAFLKALEQRLEDARFAVWKADLIDRAPYVAGAVLILLLYLAAAWRQKFGGALFLGSLTFAATFNLIFHLAGGRYSAAMAGLSAFDRGLLVRLGLEVAAAALLAALVTGYRFSRKGLKRRGYLMGASLHMLLSTAVLLALPVMAVVAFVGWEFPVQLPAPGLQVWFGVTAVQVVVLGYLSLAWGIITVSASQFALRRWPLKEVGDPERNADRTVRTRSLKRTVKSH